MSSAPRLGRVRVAVIDGPSGAGKTTFAVRLASAIQAIGSVVVVPTDAFLEGWAAPESVWPLLRRWVTDPLASGTPGAYRPYDWAVGRRSGEWIPVPVADVVVIEGVTAGCEAFRPHVVRTVFVGAPDGVRTARTLSRDGSGIAVPLRAWQAAESAYFDREHTSSRADLMVDGAAEVRHDPGREFVLLH